MDISAPITIPPAIQITAPITIGSVGPAGAPGESADIAAEVTAASTRTLDGTELVPIVAGGVLGKSLLSAIKTWILTGLQIAWGSVTGKPSTFPPTIGSGAGDAVAGNDSRLTDSRTPVAHTHVCGDFPKNIEFTGFVQSNLNGLYFLSSERINSQPVYYCQGVGGEGDVYLWYDSVSALWRVSYRSYVGDAEIFRYASNGSNVGTYTGEGTELGSSPVAVETTLAQSLNDRAKATHTHVSSDVTDASATHSEGKLMAWGASAAATRSAMGAGAVGDTLFQAASVAAANAILGQVTSRKLVATTKTNDDTYGADPHLTVPVVAGNTYQIEAFLIMTMGACGMKCYFEFPTSSKIAYGSYGNGARIAIGTGSTTRTAPIGGFSNTSAITKFEFFITPTTSGNVVLWWAQNVIGSSSAILESGSSMLAITK